MRKPDWSKQAERMWQFLRMHPNEEIAAPVLNSVGAGDGVYCSSFSKRISECRQKARELGRDVIMCRQAHRNGQRRTWYKLT